MSCTAGWFGSPEVSAALAGGLGFDAQTCDVSGNVVGVAVTEVGAVQAAGVAKGAVGKNRLLLGIARPVGSRGRS